MTAAAMLMMRMRFRSSLTALARQQDRSDEIAERADRAKATLFAPPQEWLGETDDLAPSPARITPPFAQATGATRRH
jgi:hypothetical protein